MSHPHIRHRSRSRYYMSPILLDHRLLKALWLGLAVLVFMTFMGGYILGFEKSDSTWKTHLDPVELVLPTASISALAEVKAQVPEFEQPGADIDVDAADAPDQAEVMIPAAAGDYRLVKLRFEEKTVEPLTKEPAKTAAINSSEHQPSEATLIKLIVSDESEQADKPDLITLALADIGFVESMQAVSNEVVMLTEPLPNNAAVQPVAEPQSEVASEPSLETPAIVDDATVAGAKYSIQVGMYSSSANAVAREELLNSANLNAYSQEYLNSNDEPRYNVRFGYFTSKHSAQQALDAFQQQFSANGFIVRFKR